MARLRRAVRDLLSPPACSREGIYFGPLIKVSCEVRQMYIWRLGSIWTMNLSSSNTLLKIRYRRRPPYHAVGEQSKGQEVKTPETTRKRPGVTSYPKNLVLSPIYTNSIEWAHTGHPLKHIHLGPHVYLSQDQNIFVFVRVCRRVQPSSR